MATIKYRENASAPWEIVKALPSIGQAVEITATELTGKSTADRAAMYAAGTRLLKVMNGDTEVLLGLGADGSTEWLGSNKPLNNLLDNSNFSNAVNQRGASSYTASGYTIDRWAIDTWDGNPLAINSGYIAIGENIDTKQYLSDTTMGGKTYTCAAKILNQAIPLCGSGTMPTENGGIIKVKIEGGFELRLQKFYNGYCGVDLFAQPGNTINVEWAALYEGSYTADTLPPYTPKGYAAELAECQRYYLSIRPSAGFVNSAASGAYFQAASAIRMRAIPSVARYDMTTLRVNGATILPAEIASVAAASTSSVLPIAIVQSGSLSGKANQPIIFEGTIDFSADL